MTCATRGCAASVPSDTRSGTPADAPTPAADTASNDAPAGAQLRLGHDQRDQALPLVLDQRRQLLLVPGPEILFPVAPQAMNR